MRKVKALAESSASPLHACSLPYHLVRQGKEGSPLATRSSCTAAAEPLCCWAQSQVNAFSAHVLEVLSTPFFVFLTTQAENLAEANRENCRSWSVSLQVAVWDLNQAARWLVSV